MWRPMGHCDQTRYHAVLEGEANALHKAASVSFHMLPCTQGTMRPCCPKTFGADAGSTPLRLAHMILATSLQPARTRHKERHTSLFD